MDDVRTAASDDLAFKPSEAFLNKALDQADLNALRIALYQLTGDVELENVTIDDSSQLQGLVTPVTLSKTSQVLVRDKALQVLRQSSIPQPSTPSREQAKALLRKFRSPQLTDEYLAFALEELAFDAFPRDTSWSSDSAARQAKDFRVVIVGAGIGGLAVAITMERLQIPYILIERESDLGGTWWRNKYPQARVDIPSHIYQYTFEKRYPWKEKYSSQPETHRYLKHIARKYGVDKHIQFNRELVSASWNEQTSQWDIRTQSKGADREEKMLKANVLVSASGLFNKPSLPNIEGLKDFKGKIFHTTGWDREFDVIGKNVAVIGTGSSGAQVMPALATIAGKLSVFQRTPNWILPVEGYHMEVTREEQWLFDHMPFYWNWYCYLKFEIYVQPFKLMTIDREWQKSGGLISEANDRMRQLATAYLTSKLGHRPDLFERCVPTHAPFGRRPVLDNGFYDALLKENVELVSNKITRIVPSGIETDDGKVRDFDIIVLGTGFEVSKYLWPAQYVGRRGVSPQKMWEKDGARAYLGMVMPGFPNFFMLYGPNSQPRGGDYYSWSEIWARYIGKCTVKMIESGSRWMECRKEVFEQYNVQLDELAKECLWETEAKGGYYVNEFGRSGVNMSLEPAAYYAQVYAPNVRDYAWDVQPVAEQPTERLIDVNVP